MFAYEGQCVVPSILVELKDRKKPPSSSSSSSTGMHVRSRRRERQNLCSHGRKGLTLNEGRKGLQAEEPATNELDFRIGL